MIDKSTIIGRSDMPDCPWLALVQAFEEFDSALYTSRRGIDSERRAA